MAQTQLDRVFVQAIDGAGDGVNSLSIGTKSLTTRVNIGGLGTDSNSIQINGAGTIIAGPVTMGIVTAANTTITNASITNLGVTSNVSMTNVSINTLSVVGQTALSNVGVAGQTTLQNTSVNGTLRVDGQTTLINVSTTSLTSSSLTILNNVSMGGNVSIGSLFVSSNLVLPSGSNTVLANASINGTLRADGVTTLKEVTLQNASINLNTRMDGSLTVLGATEFYNTVTARGASNTFTVEGQTTLSNTSIQGLTVSGNTSLSNTVITGTTDINRTGSATTTIGNSTSGTTTQLNSTATTVGGTLGVTGATTLSGGIKTNSLTSIATNGAMTIAGDQTSGGTVVIGTTSTRTTINGTTVPLIVKAPNNNGARFDPVDGQNNRGNIGIGGCFPSLGPGDIGPRRVCDIFGGFSSNSWGSEYMSLCVGNNGTSNDDGYGTATVEKMRINGASNTVVTIGQLNYRGTGDTNTLNAETSRHTIQFPCYWNSDSAFIGSSIASVNKQSFTSGNRSDLQSADLAFSTRASSGGTLGERMRITDTGCVGVGTANPTYTLDVSGDIKTTGAIRFHGNSMTGAIVGDYQSATDQRIYINPIAQTIQDGKLELSNSYGLYNIPYGSAGNGNFTFRATTSIGGNGSSRMLIQNNGNVGIGAINPTYTLDVSGTLGVTRLTTLSGGATVTGNTSINTTGSGNTTIGNSNGYTYLSGRHVTVGSEPIGGLLNGAMQVIGESNAVLMVIPKSNVDNTVSHRGNIALYASFIGVGVPGSGDHVPRRAADIYAGYTYAWTSEYLGFAVGGGDTSGRTDQTQTTERMRIQANGNVGIANTNPSYPLDVTGQIRGTNLAVTSDRRIKSNIVDVEDDTALQLLRRLKPKTYTYKDTLARGTEPVYGFIAQEVQEVLNYSTSITKDAIPNIYESASLVDDMLTLTTFNTVDLSRDISGSLFSKLKIKANDGRDEFANILEVIDDHTLKVDTTLWSKDSSGNLIGTENLFVYGQEVNDFHNLNKDAIWTVATAALQEVDRQLQAEKQKTAALETTLASCQETLASLVARVNALEQR